MRHFAVRWVFFFGATLLAPTLTAEEKSPAEQFFWQGRDAMRGGDFEVACRAFEQSIEIQPTVGAFLNLALSEERLGRTAKAIEHFQRVVDLVDPKDERYTLARDKIRDLSAPTEGPAVASEGGKGTEAAAPTHAAAPDALARGAGSALALAPAPPPPPVATTPAWAFVLAGAGMTAIGVSAGTGIAALTNRSEALEHCTGKFCDAQGLAAADASRWYAAVSTATLIGGLLSVGAATYIFVRPSSGKKRDVAVGFSSSPVHGQLFVTGSL